MIVYPEGLSYIVINIRKASSCCHSLINRCCESISPVAFVERGDPFGTEICVDMYIP
jgi:hypothetical protein